MVVVGHFGRHGKVRNVVERIAERIEAKRAEQIGCGHILIVELRRCKDRGKACRTGKCSPG